MPVNAPKLNDMLLIDVGHTQEPNAQMKSEEDETDYEFSTEYEDPTLCDALTATQVIQLLTLGK